jgi:hypothetical protein
VVCVPFPEGVAGVIERSHPGAGCATAHHDCMAQITGCAGDQHNARVEAM